MNSSSLSPACQLLVWRVWRDWSRGDCRTLRKSPRDDSKQHSCLDKQTARRKGGEVVTAVQDWEGALEELNKLKDAIDSNTFVPVLEQLQQRSWLMHWGLYIFFNHENGRNLIIDYLFQDRCRPQP